MKIVILNGSPKGKQSVTMQYMQFIEKKHPEVDFQYLNIAQQIKYLENNEEIFEQSLQAIQEADGVIWAFPVYFMMVIAEYKRFIELIFERGKEGIFKNKFAAVFTTSIHFYDHTAHQYMSDIIYDLKMKYVDSYSAEMHDLVKKDQQKQVLLFAEHFFKSIEEKKEVIPVVREIDYTEQLYVPSKQLSSQDIKNKKIILITDSFDPQSNLGKMIIQTQTAFNHQTEIIDLSKIIIKGGCLGCIRCGYANECVYESKDDYIKTYREKILPADIVIFAGTIKDRYLSSLWKRFFDRSFFMTHTPRLRGKQLAYLISGPLSQLSCLQEILKAHAQLERANLVGIISDEIQDSRMIDLQIDQMASNMIKFSLDNYCKPMDFLGVGGVKIFRDDMYGTLRFPFIADYKYYKKNGFFDFPQKKRKVRFVNGILRLLSKIPFLRNEIYQNKMKEEMIKPLNKIVKQVGAR